MSFLLEINGTTCMINPSKRSGFPLSDARRCDLIFITSEEPACFDPELVEAIHGRTYAAVVAPAHMLARVGIADKFKVDVKAGDRFSLRGLDVQACKSARPQSQNPVGFVISSAKWKVYYSGSTYAFTDMCRIRADVAILPVAGTQCMDAFAAAGACREMRPKYAIPIAYERSDSAAASTGEFSSQLPECTKPIVLRPGAAARLKK